MSKCRCHSSRLDTPSEKSRGVALFLVTRAETVFRIERDVAEAIVSGPDLSGDEPRKIEEKFDVALQDDLAVAEIPPVLQFGAGLAHKVRTDLLLEARCDGHERSDPVRLFGRGGRNTRLVPGVSELPVTWGVCACAQTAKTCQNT